MNACEYVQELKRKGCYYNPETGGIYSKNGKRRGKMGTNGYRICLLQKDKHNYYMCEHRVVWWWHYPETDEALVIDHVNCDRSDNRINNLQAVTQQRNAQLIFERGRGNACKGEKSGKTKLTDREALTIRYLAQEGMPRKDIAQMIVGDKAEHPLVTVNRIIRKTRFGHLEDPADIWAVYPTIVAATARTDLPKEEQIANAAMGLAGEVGEVVDMLKKGLYQGHDVDEYDLMEELGDVLFYWTWLAVLQYGFDRAEIMLRNAVKLHERYPNGFDPDKSLHRKEGDI